MASSSRQTSKQSAPCNVKLLVELRQRRGWTQQQLAAASGYSDRVISKAECGHSISTTAIKALAGALSTDRDSIRFTDLICDTVTVAEQFISEVYRHQGNVVSAAHTVLDDDLVVRLAGDPSVLPFAGEYRGLAAVERMFRKLFSIAEVPPGHDPKPWYTYSAQNREVTIFGQSWLQPIGTPLKKPTPVVHRVTFRGGKIFSFDGLYDTLYAATVIAAARKHARR